MAYDGTLKFDTSMDASGFQKDASKLDQLVKGLSVFEIIKKGMQMIGDSIGAAVSRYDTLNKFPAIMEQMGYGAENGEKAIKKLSDGIQGLPTTLDSIVASTKQLTIATGSLDKGTKSALALNNAFLASDASSEDASRGATQYIQALSSGKMQQQEWMTLTQTMTYSLQQAAKAFGFTGTNAIQQLGGALKGGTITMTQFNDKIIELNDGVGGFAEVAKTATGGIGTAWTNLRTAFVRKTADMISAIDGGLSKTRFVSIENIIGSMKDKVVASLELVAKGFGFVAQHADILVPAIVAVTAAYGATKGIDAFVKATKAASVAIYQNKAATALMELTTKGNTATEIIATTVKGKVAGAEALQTAAKKAGIFVDEKGIVTTAAGIAITEAEAATLIKSTGAVSAKTIAVGLLTGQMTLSKAATEAWSLAMSASPIGIIIASAAVLVGGLAALDSAMSASTAKHRQLKQAASDLVATNKDILGSIRESATAYHDRAESATTDANAAELLAKQIYDLADAENKSESEKQKLKAMVDQLNAAMPSLNLQYNIERDLLSKTADETYNLIAAKKAEAQQIAAQERAVEIAKEQITIDERLLKTREQLAELEGVMGDRVNHNTREGLEQLELRNELIQAEAELSAQSAALGESLDALTNTMVENSKTHDTAAANLIDYGYAVDETTGRVVSLTDATEEYGDTNQKVLDLSETEINNYAKKFKMSADDVRTSLAEMGNDTEAWVAEQEKALRAREVAQQDYVNAIKAGNVEITASEIALITSRRLAGEELTAIEQAKLDQWIVINDQLKASIESHTDSIVNSFDRLPKRSKMSLDKMIKNLQANREQYNAWRANMAEISGLVSDEMLAELERLGPGFNSELEKAKKNGYQKILELDGELTGAISDSVTHAENEFGKADLATPIGTMIAAGIGVITAMHGDLTKAGTDLADDVGEGMDASTAPSEASQAIADAVIKDLANADYSGITAALATAITTGTTDVITSATTMAAGVLTEIETMKTDSEKKVSQMMVGINTEIVTKSLIAKIYAAALASGIVTNLSTMVSGGVQAASNLMAGMLQAMRNGEQALYDKAKSIAKKISETIANAWDEHSPSRVSYGIMEFFLIAMFNAMDDMEGKLLGKALSIADGLTDTLTISPEVSASLMARLQAIVETAPFSASTFDRISSPSANQGAGITYNFYMTQNNTSPKPLSESELTRNAKDMFTHALKFQLP